ncbi:MAG TPA: hypothetical protein VII38_14025 [Polyangia bacterium]|jgi:hypothetical protein
MTESLIDLARATLEPLDAPARFVCSCVIGPEPDDPDVDVDEWIALDFAVARRMVEGGTPVVLRVSASELASAPALDGLLLEVSLDGTGDDERQAQAIKLARAIDHGLPVRAALATGATGIDAYRSCGIARRVLGSRVSVRVRWDEVLDIKGAALALSFGADELAGPLAPRVERLKLAQFGEASGASRGVTDEAVPRRLPVSVGGPPEPSHRPSPAYVEQLIRAAGRQPVRR